MSFLLDYRSAIRSGEIKAGMDMVQELDRLIEDLDSPEYIYDTHDADIRIDFIEHCIKLTKSPYYGKPMELLLWQKAFIEAAYSFKIKSVDTGKWINRFQEILLIISRKNGKTELVAALLLAELILGKEGADIICSGMDDGTADLAYQTVDTMRLMIDPKQVDTWRNQKGIKNKVNGSHIFKVSDSTRQKEGRSVDVCSIDEVWSLTEQSNIYKTLQQSGGAKEDFMMFMFGSEGFVVDGFLDKKRDEYSKIIAGEDDTEAAKRKLPWMYTQDSEQEVWQTDGDGISAAWEKSNPSIGKIKKFGYLRDRVDEARKSRVDRVFVLCKDFNIKQATAAAWLMPEEYRYPATYNIDELRGCICLGAVDLSETTDMTSARVLIVRKDCSTRYILQHYWIPEGKLESSDDKNAGAQYRQWAQDGLLTICEGNDIDLTLVADWFYELYKQYGIMLYKCGYDVRFSREFVAKMESYGFECEVVLQSKQTLSNAVKLCENDFRSRLINYNENPVDMWTLGNAALEVDNYGNCQIVKIKGQPGKRIDGAVTYSIVYEMFRRYRSDIIALAK